MKSIVLSPIALFSVMNALGGSSENSPSSDIARHRQAAFAAANSDAPRNGESATKKEKDELPLLPPADPNDSSIPRINLGETISFEEMGPIIINSDGTTRRITNWDQMTKREQEVSWRRIKKRNEERRTILLREKEEADASKIETSEKEL
jgi:hypothetical protein